MTAQQRRPISLVGKAVRSGSGKVAGKIREDKWPWVLVDWSDGKSTWSDGRLFPELRRLARLDHRELRLHGHGGLAP